MRRISPSIPFGVVVAAASILGGAAVARAQEPRTEEEKDQRKLERLARPWPDAAGLAERQAEAEGLPLFASDEPLDVTLEADFDAVNDDRTVDSLQRFPGVLTVAGESGEPVAIPVRLGSRGNLRLDRRVCWLVPLRVEFSKKPARGTPFEDQGSLKLVTHCKSGDDYEQRVLGEALAYRIARLVTPASFRIRLIRMTYVDSGDGDERETKWAFFIEDPDDVAKRIGGRIAPVTGKMFHQLDLPTLLRLSVFQFAIGNTDYSIYGLHNVRLVQDPDAVLRPIAYDFDVSGLVDPPYGQPARKLKLRSLGDRLYRGPCLNLEELEPILDEFRSRQGEILALYDAEPMLDRKHRREALRFLEDFFDIIGDPDRTRTFFSERCRPAAGM